MRVGACAGRLPASLSHAVAGPSPRCYANAFRAFRGAQHLRTRVPRRSSAVHASGDDCTEPALVPRVFDGVEGIRAQDTSEAHDTKEREEAVRAVFNSTSELDPHVANGFQQLEDAATFVGWTVLNLQDGSIVGEVRHALAMAGGEVVAQMGDSEMDEHDGDDSMGINDFFSPAFVGADDEDDRDDDDQEWDEEEFDNDGDWEVIYEGEEGSVEDSSLDEGVGAKEYASDEFSVYGDISTSKSDAPPLSLVLRIRGERLVDGAGGVTNKEPVAHLIPLASSMFPRWNESTKVLALDAPLGLLDLGFRQSEIRALRRDLAPYCSQFSATQQGMPQRRVLVRAGRGDLVGRVSQLGDWSSVALALGFVTSRKPDGYWENIDLVAEALLALTHAFWFEDTETSEDGMQTKFWYNDVSGALSFETPDLSSGGGLDQPVMPAIADVFEARRYDLHHAILLHGGYKEVAMKLNWLPKRTSENRHLLQFSALQREMESFIAENEGNEELVIPPGRFPSENMLHLMDRDDLIQGVQWHGGYVQCARRMGRLNLKVSALGDAETAARALRLFAEERARDDANEKRLNAESNETFVPSSSTVTPSVSSSKHARLLDVPVMPTEQQLVNAGRHNLRWALRIHDRDLLAEIAGLADPNKADPNTGKAKKMRLQYSEARKFMRNALQPRLLSAIKFREWSTSGNRPWFIPARPYEYYSERGTWVSWYDFLGTPEHLARQKRVRDFLPYAEAKRYMRKLRMEGEPTGQVRDVSSCTQLSNESSIRVYTSIPPPETSKEFTRWATHSGQKPDSIPQNPAKLYKKRGEWVSWDDFLGREPGTVRLGRQPRAEKKQGKERKAEGKERIANSR